MTDTTNASIAFIGAGNMATAIIGGLISQGYQPNTIWATDVDEEKLASIAKQWGVNTSTDNIAVCNQVDVVVLAVKPQGLKTVCLSIADAVSKQSPLVISIAAGIEVSSMARWLGNGVPIVRCMPNTPSLVKLGASGLFASDEVSDDQKTLAESILSAVGIAVWVQSEVDIDAVTAVSGSGPAYFFMVMESMIQAGIEQGLPAEVAKALTLQTALGAATMALQSEFEPAELRRRVTSPNGTTERAIMAFEAGGLPALFGKAMSDCAERSKSLSKELGSD